MLAEELLEVEYRFDIEKVDKDILEIQSKIKSREQPLAEAWATAEGLKRKKDKLRLELDSLTALYPMLKSLFLRKKISETSEVYERQCNDIRETCQQLAALEHLILGVSHAKDQDASPLPIWQINLPSMTKSSDGYTFKTFAASDIRIGMDQFVSDALEEIKKSGISLSD